MKHTLYLLLLLCTFSLVAQGPGGGFEESGEDVIIAELTNSTLSNNCSDGTISISLLGGTEPFLFDWSDDQDNGTNLRQNLSAGEYCLTVTDASCNVASECFNITCQSITIEGEVVPCIDGSNGGVNITITGLVPVSIEWIDINGVSISTEEDLTNVNAGIYIIRVENSNGEIISEGFEVVCCQMLLVGINHNGHIDCPGETGELSAQLTQDGNLPYSLSWSTGADTETIDQLEPGTYSLSVTDQLGCEDIMDIELLQINECTVESTIQPARCNVGGSISLDTQCDPELGILTYEWSDSGNNALRVDLEPGDYSVTITDESGCEYIRNYTIEYQELEFLEKDLTEVCPLSDLGTANFRLNYFSQNTTIRWPDAPGYTGYTRSNLSPGFYSVIVSNDCEQIIWGFEIKANCSCQEWQNINHIEKITHACSTDDFPLGTIQLKTNINGQDLEYTFVNSTTIIEDGKVASVPVTSNFKVTDPLTGCSKIFSAKVLLKDPSELEVLNIEGSCPIQSNGMAQIAIDGDYEYFYWDNKQSYNVENRTGLWAGTHTLSIYDACGLNTYDVFIPKDSVDVIVGEVHGCGPTFNYVDYEIVGSNPPFTIVWEATQSDLLLNVKMGREDYTVTDSKGCTYNGSIIVPDPIKVLEEIGSCEGVQNGRLKLCIGNEGGELVTISHDISACSDCQEYPLIEPTNDTLIIIELDNLPGGIPIIFSFDIGGCAYDRTYVLDKKTWSEGDFVDSFEDEDGIFHCVFDQVCNDLVIEEGLTRPAKLGVENIEDAGFNTWTVFGGNCGSTDLLCGEEVVGTLELESLKMRSLEAKVFLEQLGVTGGEFTDLSIFTENICKWVWVCPHLETIPSSYSGNFFGGGFPGKDSFKDENGCNHIDCDDAFLFFGSDYVICDSIDWLPEWIEPYVNQDTKEKCKDKTSYDVYSLFNSLSFLTDEIWDNSPLFKDSELKEFYRNYEDNPARYCSRVTVCNDDFSIIDTDIDDFNCDVEIAPGDSLAYQTDSGQLQHLKPCEPISALAEPHPAAITRVLCAIDCGTSDDDFRNCWIIKDLPDLIDIKGLDSLKGGSTYPTKRVLVQPQNESMKFFMFSDYVTENGILLKKPIAKTLSGIVKTNLKEGKYSQYNSIPNYLYIYEDFRTAYLFGVENKEAYYEVHYGFMGENRAIVSSAKTLDLKSVKFNSFDNISISGSAKGNITINGKSEVSITELSSFEIIVDGDMNVISSMTKPINSRSDTKYVNGKSINYTNDLTNDRADLSFTNTLAIQDIDYIDNSQKTLLLGKGSILHKGSHYVLNNEGLYVAEKGVEPLPIVLTKDIESIKTAKFTTDKEGNIVAALSFHGQLSIEDELFKSEDLDILFLWIDKDGNLKSYYLIDNDVEDTIEDIFVIENMIQFGLTSKGDQNLRKYGNFDFECTDLHMYKSFTSHIFYDDMKPIVSSRSDITKNDKEYSDIDLYPNPFNNKLTVELPNLNLEGAILEVYTNDGRRVMEVKLYNSSPHIQTLDMSSMINGIYSLRVMIPNQDVFTKKIIKL